MSNNSNEPVVHTITTQEQSRWKSWVLWTSLASLLVYVALRFFNVDLGEPVNRILELALPILVGLGLINDPSINGAYVNPDKDKVWYSRASIWVSIAAFAAYILQLITGRNVDETVNTLATLLITFMTAFGIIKPETPTLLKKPDSE